MDKDMISKKPIMGYEFFKYKQEIVNLQELTTRHLNNLMADIEDGLPDVKKENCTRVSDVNFKIMAEGKDW